MFGNYCIVVESLVFKIMPETVQEKGQVQEADETDIQNLSWFFGECLISYRNQIYFKKLNTGMVPACVMILMDQSHT